MTDKTYSKPVTVLFSKEEKRVLEELAERKGLTLSSLIRMVVKEWLQNELKVSGDQFRMDYSDVYALITGLCPRCGYSLKVEDVTDRKEKYRCYECPNCRWLFAINMTYITDRVILRKHLKEESR